MHYTVYKTTCIINNKFYIGAHKTKNLDDGYLGSGTIFCNSLKKHKKENFRKELLADFDNSKEMFALEKELVANEKGNPLCMNIREGGLGGFDYTQIIHSVLMKTDCNFRTKTIEHCRQISPLGIASPGSIVNSEEARCRGNKKGKESWSGMHHKQETRRIMSEKKQGPKNNQFGKIWVYSLTDKRSVIITKDLLPQYLSSGYLIGRKIKF